MIWPGRLALPQRIVGGARGPRQHRFRRWRPIVQRAVWPDRVVVLPPALDQHLSFLQRIEDLPVQKFVPQLAVERFIEAVLPRAAGLDEHRLHADPTEPVAHDLRHKLRPVVGADMLRRPTFN